MNLLWKIFAGLTVVVAGLVVWLCNVAGGMPLSALFLDSSPIVQLTDLLLILALVLAAVLPNGRGQTGGFQKVLLWGGLAFAALITLQRLSVIRMAMERTRTTNLQVIAPSLAESLVPFALALLIAAIAAWKVASVRKPSPAASFD
jgi:hypothetical protein